MASYQPPNLPEKLFPKACGGTQQTNAFRAGSHEDHRTSLFSAKKNPMAQKKGGLKKTLENQRRFHPKNGGFFIQMIFLLAIFRWRFLAKISQRVDPRSTWREAVHPMGWLFWWVLKFGWNDGRRKKKYIYIYIYIMYSILIIYIYMYVSIYTYIH